MNIALFGGRFDPPHNGHLAVAREVLKTQKNIDELWFLPDNTHQWNPIIASPKDRILMLEKICEEKMKVDATAIELGGMTEILSVIKVLRKKYPYSFVFVSGSDQIPTFSKWTHWEELQKELHFLIVARKNFPTTNLPENCTLLEDKNYLPLEDSSTHIREKIKKGGDIAGLVADPVKEYIIEHSLYQ